MKKFLLSMAIMLIAAASAFAQVPTVMMYQVQVNHGKAAAQNVTIEMQLRTSQSGSAVWNQTFQLKDVKNGSVQNLGLDFGSKVNLGTGEYWLATIVDGVEKGCAKLTSVPYAMVAKTLEGVITREELIGTWKGVNENEEETTCITFREDGTFSAYTDNYDSYYGEHEIERFKGTWMINGVGNVFFDMRQLHNVKEKANFAKKVIRKESGYYESEAKFVSPTFYDAKKHQLTFVTQEDSEMFENLKSFTKSENGEDVDDPIYGGEGLPEDGELDPQVVGSWTTTIVDDEDGDYTVTFIINADGTYTQLFQGADWSDSVSGVWCTKGNTVYFKQNDDSDDEEEVMSATYAINGDTLTLSIEEDGETEEVTLEKK